jgi:asparagine synthase (glutamine-hydrolysing)
MVRSLARRGPDGDGIYQWPTGIFGHRRLAIFDLSDAGRQPMLSADGQVGVTFNGAIYNFPDLRADLEKAGHRFHSQTDTEVLVEGYREWGIDGLVPRLRGMFAFAIWDNSQRSLYLVRDRLGVKPLVYWTGRGQIAFASTVRALRDANLVDEIDPTAVLEYLEWGFVTDERTIYSGAHKVQAGTIVEWRNGELRQRRYWTLPEVRPDLSDTPRITFEEAVEETERLLIEAVRLRLFADVPVGALLSGGIDSGLVCWAMTKLNANIRAFTVGTPGSAADETGPARDTARMLGIDHEVVDVSFEQPPSMEELISAYGEPFGCSSALAMLRVSQIVKPKATVLLTGDGGDDVFLGYPFHRHFWAAQRLARAIPRPAARLWPTVRPIIDAIPRMRRMKHFMDYATGGLGAVTRVFDGLPFYGRHRLLGDRIASSTVAQRLMPLSFNSARNILPEFLVYEQNLRFVAEFMTKVDGGTMHYALEARSPFLDQELWNFAATLPFSLRLHGGELKAILREIARRRIGRPMASRKKQGFTIPVQEWLPAWKNDLKDSLRDSVLEREGWMAPGSMATAFQHVSANGQAPKQLWYLLVLEHWMRHEHERSAPAMPTAPALTGRFS